MKKIIILFCFILGISLAGCNKQIEQRPISLNNGERWSVDTAMLEHITAMENAVTTFSAGEDISTLKNSLQTDIKGLTSKCTMQGQAHDELHKWLMPLMQTVEAMDGPESLESLKQHFITFHTFFE